MSRLILLILIGLIANYWWRNLQRQRMAGTRAQHGTRAQQADASRAAGARSGSPFSKGTASRAAPALPEPMVRCAQCDTHLPVSEATSSGGRHFCHPRHAHDYAMRAAQQGSAPRSAAGTAPRDAADDARKGDAR